MDDNGKWEELVDNSFGNLPLEEPSTDFTKNVMRQIGVSKVSKKLIYKPLIPRKLLVFIYVLFAILILSLVLFADIQGNQLFRDFDFGTYTKELSFNLPSVEFSNTVVYAVVGVGIMMMVQLVLVKQRFDKRLL